MGGTQSKPQNEIKTQNDETQDANAEFKDLRVVIDDGIKKKLTELGEYVSVFNSNDVKPLIKIVKDYKLNLETSTGQKFNFENIDNSVSQFHYELLEKISADNENISAEEKDKKFHELLKNKGLPDYLKNIYDSKLSKLKQRILEDPIVTKDSEMKNNINQILTDITGIKSKYKYFEYRYIQLNLFLIIFIQHTYSTMDNFIKTILAYTVNRDKMREDSLRDLINLLLRIMKEAELNITQKDFESIDNLMSVSETQIKKRQEQLDKAIDKARVGAIDEMLKLVMINHDIFSNNLSNNINSNVKSTDKETIEDFEKKSNGQIDIFRRLGNSEKERIKQESEMNEREKIKREIREKLIKDKYREQELRNRLALRRGQENNPFRRQFQSNPLERPRMAGINLPRRPSTNPEQSNSQFGGFIRDNSLLPQSFYEISKN